MTRRRRLVLAVVVAVAVVVVGNLAAYGHNRQLDLSAADSFTLSPETVALLHRVRAPLEIIAFLTASGPDAANASYLLDRYHELNHRITGSVVDPDANPGEARRYGITTYSTVVLTYRGREVTAGGAEEGDISTAILRLLRGGTVKVCVLTGNGEPSLADTGPDGLADVDTLLHQNAFIPAPLDLTVGASRVPSSCAAVLDLGPEQSMPSREVVALQRYLQGGGRMMLLTSSLSSNNPNPLLQPWGIGFQGGLVLDPARSEGVDWSNVVVQDLPTVSPIDSGVSSLQFPAPAGLALLSGPGPVTVSALGATSNRSYIDPNPDSGSVSFSPGDLPGPVVVAAAAEASRIIAGPIGPRVVRTRVVVTGSDTWMTNGFLDNLGNRRFFANGVDWLTDQDNLVVATSQPPAIRPLPLTPALQAELLGITVGAVPATMIGLGLLGAARGRRRRGREGERRPPRRA